MLDGHSAVLWASSIYIWGGKEDISSKLAVSSAAYNNTMYLINPAECLSKPTTTLQVVQLQTMEHGVTDERAVIPKGRAYHCASLYGKLMLITGGLVDDTGGNAEVDCSTIPVFDLERRVWIMKSSFGDVPCARCHHVAAVYGDTLMIHGGYPVLSERSRQLTADEMNSMQHALFDVCELNIATMRWHRISTQQSPALWGHTAVVYSKNVIVFGGVDVVENCESSAVAVWHTERKQWRWADFENLELRCALHTAVVDSGRMFAFSGVSFKTHAKLRTLYEFNLEYGSWRELSPKGAPPLGRIGHAAVLFNQCMLVIGGSVETPSSASLSSGKPERVVHVYNTVVNEWRACAIVSTHHGDGRTEDIRVSAQRSRPSEKSWSAGALDTAVTEAAKEDWNGTAQRVKETIARAKAIQSLADTAMNVVSMGPTQQVEQHEQSNAHKLHDEQPHASVKSIVPFDDAKRRVAEAASIRPSRPSPTSGIPRGLSSSVAQTEISPAEEQFQKIRDLREGANNEEARRAIDFLQNENAKLRAQLEEFRRGISAPRAASGVNPYEVPVFDTSATSFNLPPNENIPSDRFQSAGVTSTSTLGDFVPRLNLNAAEPPRAASAPTGYMSRTAISALVQSSLNKNVTATATMNAQPSLRASVLDPMSFLTSSQGAAQEGLPAWHPSQYAPPRSYDQLLAKAAVEGNMQAGQTSMPLALQPLLSLLSSGAQIPAVPSAHAVPSSFGIQQSLYSTPVQQLPLPAPSASPGRRPEPSNVPYTSPTPGTRFKSPSLRRLVSGQASMLSISHVPT